MQRGRLGHRRARDPSTDELRRHGLRHGRRPPRRGVPGRPDVAAAHTDGLSVFRSDGKTPADRVDDAVGVLSRLEAGDLDRDGNLGLVGVGDAWSSVPVRVDPGVGDGTLGAALTPHPDKPCGLELVAADPDGDGDTDLLADSIGGGVVLENSSSGLVFRDAFPILGGSIFIVLADRVIVTGDADGDGCADLDLYDHPEGLLLAPSMAAGCGGTSGGDSGDSGDSGDTAADTGDSGSAFTDHGRARHGPGGTGAPRGRRPPGDVAQGCAGRTGARLFPGLLAGRVLPRSARGGFVDLSRSGLASAPLGTRACRARVAGAS